MALAVLAVVGIGFTSCGDDGDGGTSGGGSGTFQGAKKVYGNTLPSEFSSSSETTKFSYDTNGFLTKIENTNSSGTKTATLSYVGNKINVVYTSRSGKVTQIIATIGSNGFASKAEYIGSGEVETYEFEYNSDGQMSKAKWGEEGDEVVYDFAYSNGDIDHVSIYQNGSLYRTNTYTYSSYNNIGYADTHYFVSSIDVIGEILSYAGALGRPNKHLLSSAVSGSSTRAYEWQLNSAGYPIQQTYTHYSTTITTIKYTTL